jgi:ubiquinone/menaquinone biosynthesis C-methylase UbiE
MSFTLQTRQAYDRWAPLYPPTAHNPFMRAEQAAMTRHWPEVRGRRVLDLACGSGRYARLLAAAGAAQVVAMDFCVPMLEQVGGVQRVCADMMRLPFAAASFDAVISGLAVGHATAIEDWMHEVSRVLRPGGALLYSDFHPQASKMGLPRNFKDQHDQVHTVPHRCFDLTAQRSAAESAGLTVEAVHEVRVGADLREPFKNCEEFYRRWDGLPVVLVVRARK